jgi:hypothetical protein
MQRGIGGIYIQLTFPQNSPQRVRVYGRHVAEHGYRNRLHNRVEEYRARIFKCLWGPGIDSKE